MRRLIKTLLVVVMMATIGGAAHAQQSKQRLGREQLAEVQARHIAQETAMDDATSKRFIETYCQFQREIWALGPRPRLQRRHTTDKETEQELKGRFSHSRKILDIRQKYYGIYSEFLTQKQIRRVYDIERQMMDRLAKQGRKRHAQGR